MVKKVQKRAVVVLSPEEIRRVVLFVDLLVTIARRIDTKRCVAKQAKAKRASIEARTGLKAGVSASFRRSPSAFVNPLRQRTTTSQKTSAGYSPPPEKLAKANKKTNTRNTEIQYLSTNKRNSLGRKDSRLQKQKINRARNFYEPCLFFQTIYPKTKNSTSLRVLNILIPRDFNDRHHCFNPGQQHVSHYRA